MLIGWLNGAIVLASCGPKYAGKVSGKISGVESDFLIMFYTSDGASGISAIDTVYLDKGKFSWSPEVDGPAHFVDKVGEIISK